MKKRKEKLGLAWCNFALAFNEAVDYKKTEQIRIIQLLPKLKESSDIEKNLAVSTAGT